MNKSRRYSELIKIPTFEERFEYLKLDGRVAAETFGYSRYLNQVLYRSEIWKKCRRDIIIRDLGYDLGIEDRPIIGKILVHHMNPITLEEVERRDPSIFDPEYLITVSLDTHNAIHYGTDDFIAVSKIATREPNDTCPWKRR